MDYKITLAETVLGQLSSDKVGYLSMVGDHQCPIGTRRRWNSRPRHRCKPLQRTNTEIL